VTTVDFHSAAYYLRYSNDLLVIRAMDSDTGKNAFETGGSRTAPTVENQAEFEATEGALDSDAHTFIAKYPGALGNSICVEVVGSNQDLPATSGYHLDFNAWSYKNNFDTGPGTSAHTASIGGKNDEVHVVVKDTTGELSGTKNTVLETYPYVSQAKGAQNADGTNNYIVDVINQRSQYIKMINFTAGMGTGAGAVATSTSNMKLAAKITTNLIGGVNSTTPGTDDWMSGYNTIEDTAQYLIDFIIAPSLNSSTDHTTLVNHLVTIAAVTRKDCMVFASPNRSAVVNTPATANANILTGVA